MQVSKGGMSDLERECMVLRALCMEMLSDCGGTFIMSKDQAELLDYEKYWVDVEDIEGEDSYAVVLKEGSPDDQPVL